MSNVTEFCELIPHATQDELKNVLELHPEYLVHSLPYLSSPLEIAIVHHLDEVVKMFVQLNPAIIDHRNTKGYPALHIAAKKGHASTVDLLIELGSQMIDTFCGDLCKSYTPLGLAVVYGKAKVIEVLMQRGCKTINTFVNGLAPIHHAAQLRHLNTVETLLRFGADPRVLTPSRRDSPLHIATRLGCVQIIKLLVAAAAELLNTVNAVDESPMYLAAVDPFPSELIETLFCLGAHAMSASGHSLLNTAIHWGNISTVYTLLRLFPDLLNACDYAGRSPLYNAIRFNNRKIGELLVALGGIVDGGHPINQEHAQGRFNEIESRLTEDRRAKLRHRIYFQDSLLTRLFREDSRAQSISGHQCRIRLLDRNTSIG